MARRNKHGQFIISAGEVGTYTVCPESWRLKVVEGLDKISDKDASHIDNVKMGNNLHDQWAEQNAEAIYFQRGINILLLLFANALVLAIYIHNLK